MALLAAASVVCAIGTLGCFGSETASYSTPVGVNLVVNSKKIDNGVVSEEKLIEVEAGNPYALFIETARGRLGRDPSAIGVERADLRLGGDSAGVATLGEVFAGTVEVLFQTLITRNSYPAASTSIDASTSAGPIDLEIRFDPAGVPDADYLEILGGTFKVLARGPAAPGFDKPAKAKAELQITLQFVAFD